MEIKDLVGLSKPLTKLIDVCSKGLGHISEPYLIRKRAEAKAYEIATITEALHAQKEVGLLPHTAYSNGKLEIIAEANENTFNDFALIQNEILERKYFQEVKRQGNINNTINFTMNELENETDVSNEEVDEDWITRFFNTIENISNEQMQQLWAKILAGEIKQPHTYSLRTLDLLKNLSFKEAELFSKVGELSLSNGRQGTYFIIADDTLLSEKLNISFADILTLQDLDLIHPQKLQFYFDKPSEKSSSHLIYANNVIQINMNETSPKISLQIYKFTNIGVELLQLVNKQLNNEYLKSLATKIKTHESIEVFTAPFLNNKMEYNPQMLVEV